METPTINIENSKDDFQNLDEMDKKIKQLLDLLPKNMAGKKRNQFVDIFNKFKKDIVNLNNEIETLSSTSKNSLISERIEEENKNLKRQLENTNNKVNEINKIISGLQEINI
jgi:uncharacterized protein YukE